MIEKVGRYEFLSEPFHCDFSGRLTLGHLGNHMLNAADFHSTDRGFGMKKLLGEKRAWVLSRLAVEMVEMPSMYEKFYIETWVEGAMRYFTNRNFKVTGLDGRVYGYGRSIWAMIDTETRQPTDILAIDNGSINQWIDAEKECPIAKNGRVKISADVEQVRTIDTFYSDVDINGHINSVKYIEHVMDLWPIDWYRQWRLSRFEIAYVAEAHQGDRLEFMAEKNKPAAPEEEQQAEESHSVNISIRRGDGVECCRSRVEFVSLSE